MEQFKITQTQIKQLKNPQYKFYYLEVMDQEGRWWYLNGDFITLSEIQKIEQNEISKKFINTALYSMGNRIERQLEPLKITKTEIKKSEHPNFNFYYLDVMDQYGRWWSLSGYSRGIDKSTKIEIEEIEKFELQKGIINIDLYYIDDSRLVEKIIRDEAISYVFTLNCNEDYDTDVYLGFVHIISIDGLEYVHFKEFNNYEEIKTFALKIKDTGIVNLSYWKCLGYYDWEGDSHNEFEEKFYYDDSEDRADQDVLNMIESDRLADGTVPGFRD